MLLDPMGGVVITNDGNCILREVDVSHPTAKSMMELSRAQDEEVGEEGEGARGEEAAVAAAASYEREAEKTREEKRR